MEKITVYRVEHAVQQTGPYRVESTLASRMSDAHTSDPLRPCPSDDGLGEWWNWSDLEAVFGCASLKAVRQWFDGWEKELHDEGFCIGVYQSNTSDPGIWHGSKQLSFSYTDFDIIARMPLVDTDAVVV